MFITAALLAVLTAADIMPTIDFAPQPSPADAVLGTWDVDLRPTPDAEPSLTTMMLQRDAHGTLVGTFYNGSKMRDVVTNTAWASPRVAFATEDGSGVYHTSFRLTDDGMLEGTTHSVGRGFLAVWTAERAAR